jgi:hypothetical protein
MEKRTYTRTDINLPVKYFCESMIYNGTIKNLSENGMYISTTNFLPCRDSIEMLIPLKEEISNFKARIRRIEKVDDTVHYVRGELAGQKPSLRLRLANTGKAR